MCVYNSETTIYKCGAVEHVERKETDCKRTNCVNSKKHPINCVHKPLIELLKDFILHKGFTTEHGPACRYYHEVTFSFANKPFEQCSDKACKRVQDQKVDGFNEAVKVIRAEVVERINEKERAEQDAASMRQLRDEPM